MKLYSVNSCPSHERRQATWYRSWCLHSARKECTRGAPQPVSMYKSLEPKLPCYVVKTTSIQNIRRNSTSLAMTSQCRCFGRCRYFTWKDRHHMGLATRTPAHFIPLNQVARAPSPNLVTSNHDASFSPREHHRPRSRPRNSIHHLSRFLCIYSSHCRSLHSP